MGTSLVKGRHCSGPRFIGETRTVLFYRDPEANPLVRPGVGGGLWASSHSPSTAFFRNFQAFAVSNSKPEPKPQQATRPFLGALGRCCAVGVEGVSKNRTAVRRWWLSRRGVPGWQQVFRKSVKNSPQGPPAAAGPLRTTDLTPSGYSPSEPTPRARHLRSGA